MGKSLKGKELGKGISQRKDGRYQARFINRFGKRQTIYAMSLQEVRNQLKREQYEDFNALNVIDRDMTLDKWYEIWMDTCKRNCRNSTKETYAGNYSISNDLCNILSIQETTYCHDYSCNQKQNYIYKDIF